MYNNNCLNCYLRYLLIYDNYLLSTERCVVSNKIYLWYGNMHIEMTLVVFSSDYDEIVAATALGLDDALLLLPLAAAVRAGVVRSQPLYLGNDVFVEHETITIALLRRCCSRR